MTGAPKLPSGLLYFEDFALGQRFLTGETRLETADIQAFARQFDPQPFHLDQEAATTSFFGELVASGWHTAALTMRLLVEQGLPIAGGVIGAGGEVKWPRAAKPGDVLSVHGEVIDLAVASGDRLCDGPLRDADGTRLGRADPHRASCHNAPRWRLVIDCSSIACSSVEPVNRAGLKLAAFALPLAVPCLPLLHLAQDVIHLVR